MKAAEVKEILEQAIIELNGAINEVSKRRSPMMDVETAMETIYGLHMTLDNEEVEF